VPSSGAAYPWPLLRYRLRSTSVSDTATHLLVQCDPQEGTPHEDSWYVFHLLFIGENHLSENFRHFAATTRAADQLWSSGPSSGDSWTMTGQQWPTNNQPVQVVNGAGQLGVLKPNTLVPSNPYTAATEKIVADLAYLLGLPVPPISLWDRGNAQNPRYVAVSAWAFENVLTFAPSQPAAPSP
jgi:hypothetical protein